jgi:hypothetical protein
MLSAGASATTGSELEVPTLFYTSGATMVGLPEGEISDEALLRLRRSKRSTWKTVAIATMLPFAQVFEPLSHWQRLDIQTTNTHVIFIGEEDAQLFESPSIVAVHPKRESLRFRPGRRVRRLSPRVPFIPTSSFVPEEE